MRPSPVNDRVVGLTDGQLRELVDGMAEFSRFLESECRTHDVEYFDGRLAFRLALQQAEGYLVGDGVA